MYVCMFLHLYTYLFLYICIVLYISYEDMYERNKRLMRKETCGKKKRLKGEWGWWCGGGLWKGEGGGGNTEQRRDEAIFEECK